MLGKVIGRLIEGNMAPAMAWIELTSNVNHQIGDDDEALLHIGARLGLAPLVERLLRANAQLELPTRRGLTPLHCAAAAGSTACVAALIGARAALEARTGEGLTPLMLGSIAGQLDVVRGLTDANASLTATNPAGHTALALAEAHHRRSIKIFLRRKAKLIDESEPLDKELPAALPLPPLGSTLPLPRAPRPASAEA